MSGNAAIPELDRKGLREFGLVTGGIVAVLFGVLLPWLLGRPFPVWPWVFCGMLAAWSLTAPMSLRPVYRVWMKFGLLMSKVLIPVMMSLVFFLVMTPLGLVRRAFGLGEIRKRRDPSAMTYRVDSTKTEPERLKRPF